MNDEHFEATFKSIRVLNNTDGPNRNIFEPKFQAREQIRTLMQSLDNVLRECRVTSSSTLDDSEAAEKKSRYLHAQEQMCRCVEFLGTNLFETEEDADGEKALFHSYEIATHCVHGSTYDFSRPVSVTLKEILARKKPICNRENDFRCVETYLEILNAVGVFLSSRESSAARVGDAMKVLQEAEECYELYADYAKDVLRLPNLEDLPIDDSGELDFTVHSGDDDVEDEEAKKNTHRLKKAIDEDTKRKMKSRLRVENAHISTLFYLAQAHGASSDVVKSSQYCHHTMVMQLKCKKDFSRKDWATNAVHLSGFYASEEEFACALHCLRAAEYMMPKTPKSEELMGVVEWGWVKYHKNRLRHFAELKMQGEDPTTLLAPRPDRLNKTIWWQDFPLPIPSVSKTTDTPMNTRPSCTPGEANSGPVVNYDDAKEEFKVANGKVQAALELHPYDGCCTDYIAITQDLTELYKFLAVYEPDFDRRVAMQTRRIDLLSKFPEDLNFQSYTTLIRQLTFDLGDMVSDLADMRIQQKEELRKKDAGQTIVGHWGTKAASEKKINELTDRAMGYFSKFIELYHEGETADAKVKKMPEKLEPEAVIPLFRCFMRLARLEARHLLKTPQEEYESIGRSCTRYKTAVDFAKKHNLMKAAGNTQAGGSEDLQRQMKTELDMAEQMVPLLDGKQKEVWRAFNRQ